MEALLESLTLHKASQTVAEAVAGAFRNICVNGISFVPVSSICASCAFAARSFAAVLLRRSFFNKLHKSRTVAPAVSTKLSFIVE